jgi:ribosomal protein L11 methylase PrmA
MTPDIAAYMNEGAVILASGIIVERSEDVIECFRQHGFCIAEKVIENGWCALAVKKC